MDICQVMIEAQECSTRSTCADKKVGCVLLDAEGVVLAKGFNHVLDGHDCDACLHNEKSSIHCSAVHAEILALIMMSKHYRSDSCKQRPEIAVCTLEPCVECTKALVLSGVKRIYYDKPTNPRKTGKSVFQIICPTGIWQQFSIDYGQH